MEEMKNIYVGQRYVPKVMGQWDITQNYEGLSIVIHQGDSYTSKKHVPAGIEIDNEEFWVITGNYNAQIADYQNRVSMVEDMIDQKADTTYVDSELDTLETLINQKADTTYVDSEVNTLNTAINQKADTTYVDTELGNKADTTYVDDALDEKTTLLNEKVTLKIPSDYSSIMNALTEAKKYTTLANVEIEILLESGYEISDGVNLTYGDYSNIVITSEDDIVFLTDGFSGNVFTFIKCSAPTINILINAEGKCNHGISYTHNSQGRILSGSGVTHAGSDGLYIRHASTVVANNTIFTHSGQNGGSGAGITAWGASSISANGADVSDALYYGFRVAHGSIGEFDSGKANRCGRHGVRASQNAILASRYIEATDCGTHGLYALDSSYINGTQADVSRSSGRGIMASGASMIEATQSVINECSTGVFAERGSTINIYSSEILDTSGSYGIYARHTSTVEARNINMNGNQEIGISAGEVSKVNASSGTIRGSRSHGVYANQSSDINVNSCSIRNNEGHGIYAFNSSRITASSCQVWQNGENDLNVERAGIINAYGTMTSDGAVAGGANIMTPQIENTNISSFNTLSSDGYITN